MFIVNEDTFPIHLNYLFAGTGAGEKEEHSGLLADIKRVRLEDRVIFYLEGVGFFGFFKVADKDPIVFKEDSNYLEEELKKKLIYRVRLEPSKVYSKGVSERKALDLIPESGKARDILWSLVYRKLKGKRGCTPLLPQEEKRLIELIKSKNDGETLEASDKNFTWEENENKIGLASEEEFEYEGPQKECGNPIKNIKDKTKASEHYLQAYFTENIGEIPKLNPICGKKEEIRWFGNEISCGTGMQKMDLDTLLENEKFRVIELKASHLTRGTSEQIVENQLPHYIDWIESRIEIKKENITPVVVAKKREKKLKKDGSKRKNWGEALKLLQNFNNNSLTENIKFFEYETQNNRIKFSKVSY